MDHRHLPVRIAFALAFACSTWGAANAAPAPAPAPAATATAKSDAEQTPDVTEVRDNDAQKSAAESIHAIRLFAPPPTAVPSLPENTHTGQEISNSIKETLRPLHEDLAHSGILNVIRNMESELGLSNNREFKEGAAGERSQGDPKTGDPQTTSWDHGDHGSATSSRPRSAAQIEEDKFRASLMLQQLIDELTPWAVAAVAVYLVGYGIKLTLDYKRAKAARRRSRSAKRSRHKRRSRQSDTGLVVQATPSATSEAEPITSPANNPPP